MPICIKEYDVVIALREISNIPKGCRGTVLIAKDDIDTLIVEFVDDNNNTIDTTEVKRSDVELIKS